MKTENLKLLQAIAGILMVLFAGYLDNQTGANLGFSIFYLIPILFVTWYVGRIAGILISILSIAVWILADFAVREFYPEFFVLFWNTLVRLGLFIIIVLLLSKIKTLLEKEKQNARRDYLTKIANRQAFFEVTQTEITRSKRYKHPLTVSYIDCDNFKSINDSFGHKEGDRFLRLVASTIQKNIRVVDTVARLGGDEFAILMPETDYQKAQKALLRIKDLLLSASRDKRRNITYSIGAVTFTDPEVSVDEMIKRSDSLMYLAKKGGKNTIKHESA